MGRIIEMPVKVYFIENTEVSKFLLLIIVPLVLFSLLWKVVMDKNNVVC